MRSKPWMLALAALLLLTGGQVARAGNGPVTLTGEFVVLWGDGRSGAADPATAYRLAGADGRTTALLVPDELLRAAGGVLALNRQRVTVSGVWAGTALQAQTLHAETGAATAMPATSQPWVNVLCKFQDVSAEPKPQPYFEGLIGEAYPGLDHFWREVSFDHANLVGSYTIAGWLTLPQPRSYYVYGDPPALDHGRAVQDCTQVADAQVYFPAYYGINLAFNDELDGYAWGGSWWLTIDGQTRLYGVTWLPPWGYENQSVLAHETGHGFGLPHSSGMYGQTYDNAWDVMSNAWLCHPPDPTYGCTGQHTIAFHKDLLGWIPAAQEFVYPGTGQYTITLQQIALPQTNDYLFARVPVTGSPVDFYTVEARRRVGYDVQLPGDAVIIHQVDTARSIPAHVVDIDGNGNTGDEGAMWRVGETYIIPENSVPVSVLSATATGFVVAIGAPTAPAITELRPPAVPAGGPAFVLTVRGTNFTDNSMVRWNGSGRTTQFISVTELRAWISAADIAVAGDVAVTVYAPPPGGGGSSPPFPFRVLNLPEKAYLPAIRR